MDTKENNIFEKVESAFSHFNKMIRSKAYDDRAESKGWGSRYTPIGSEYSLEDIQSAIKSGDVGAMRQINDFYYGTNTSFRRIIDYFAFIYLYYYTLDLKGLSQAGNLRSEPLKLYNNCLSLLDNLNIPDTFGQISKKVLLHGIYYGIVNDNGENHLTITELPFDYCRTLRTSAYGTPIVEFDMNYFSRLDGKKVKAILGKFPPEIQIAYKSKTPERWIAFPPERACVFFFDSTAAPPIFDILLDIINFDEQKKLDLEKDRQELDKILVERFALDDDSDLEVKLTEMAGIHQAVSGMLANQKNIDLLTTLADEVAMLDTKNSSRVGADNVKKMLLPKYEGAGLSYEVFASTGATSLEKSLENTTSFMSQLIEKYSVWLTVLCYSKFTFEKLNPVVTILPITWYNRTKMHELYLKSAQFGYSWIMPYVASGKKQSTILDTVYLEQDLLKLKDKMRPLSSSYTETDNGDEKDGKGNGKEKPKMKPKNAKVDSLKGAGRPSLDAGDRNEKTNRNLNSQ